MSNIFYPKKHRFYRKTPIDSNVELRPIYGDLYGQTNTTTNINTTVDPAYLLASTTLTSTPQYGGGELAGATLQYYVNAVSGSHTAILPRLKVYKADSSITLTTGEFPPISTTDISTFSSYLDYASPWISEDFAGTNKGMGDRQNYTKIYMKSFYSSRYEIAGEDWFDYLEHMNFFGAAKRATGNFKTLWKEKLFGKTWTLTEQGADSFYGEGKYVIKDLKTIFGTDLYIESKYISNNLDVWIEYGAVQKEEVGGWTTNKYNNYDHDFVGRITQFNSIFNYVSEAPDIEDVKVQSVGTAGDDVVMYTESSFTINDQEKLTGGSSGQMRNFYENLSGTTADLSPQYTKVFGATPAGSTTGGTAVPQSVMASMDYLPLPYVLDIGASGNVVGGVGTDQTPPATCQEIEINFKVDEMSPVISTYDGTSWHYHRGFFIIFAQKAPLSSDSFFDYIKRLDVEPYGEGLTATGIWILRNPTDADVPAKLSAVSFLDKSGSHMPTQYSSNDANAPFSMFDSISEFNSSMDIPYGSWTTLRFKMDVRKNQILVYSPDSFDENGAMRHMVLNLNEFPNTSGDQPTLNSMSIWLNNFRAINVSEDDNVGEDGLNPNMLEDASGYRNKDMSNSVLIDSINFKNYNNKLSNATVCAENPVPSDLYIPPAPVCIPTYSGSAGTSTVTPTISGNASVADNYYGSESTLTHSNMSFGFDEIPSHINSAGGMNILLNNFNVTDGTLVSPISGGTASGSKNAALLKASISLNTFLNYDVDIGGPAAEPDGFLDKWVQVTGGVGSIDGFTQKGIIVASGAGFDGFATSGSWNKSWNPYVMARVLAANGDGTDIVVDKPEIFDLPHGEAADGGTDYIMWRPDATSGSFNIFNESKWLLGSGNVGVTKSLHQRQPRKGNLIYLNRPTNVDDQTGQAFSRDDDVIPLTMASYFPLGFNPGGTQDWRSVSRLGSIFISPRKYWLNLHIVNASGATWGEWYRPRKNDDANEGLFNYKNQRLKGRYYGSPIAASGGGDGLDSQVGTFGSTNNESLYTDGMNARAWHTYINGEGIFEVSTDYGWGIYQDGGEESLPKYGGYINETAPISGSYDYIDLDAFIKQDSPELQSKFNFALIPFLEDYDANRPYFINIDAINGSKPPQLFWGFDVPIGEINNFTAKGGALDITPEKIKNLLEPKATNIQFTWEEQTQNVWYRMLWVDTDLIQSKYHKANFIAPFNENPGVDSSYYYYSSSAEFATTTNGVALQGAVPSSRSTIEGFQGWGFSGTTSVSGTSLTLGSAGEYTMLCHLIPVTSGTIMEAYTYDVADVEQFILELTPDSKLKARMNTGDVVLRSTTTYDIDGVQPLAVAITYDKTLDNNNFKMYVNNSLEDTADYTSDFNNSNLCLRFANNYTGPLEEISWHTKAAHFPRNANTYSLPTKRYPDLTGNNSYSYQSRLFLMDYHNIRGTAPTDVARSNIAAWKITGV